MDSKSNFAQVIKEMRDQLDDIKKTQFMGESNSIMYRSESPNTWDYDQILSFNLSKNIMVAFIADKQDTPIVSFDPIVWIDGAPVAPTNDIFVALYDYHAQGTYYGINIPVSPKVKSQLIYVRSRLATTHRVQIKLRANATDTGTFIVGGVF